MAGKRNGGYSARDALYDNTMQNADQVFQGLVDGSLKPLQEARPDTLRGGEVGLCDLPTHCFRSVSQRSLSVPWRWTSAQLSGPPNLPASTDIIGNLTTSGQGALGSLLPQIFADANDNTDRQRIYDMVLFALRADVKCMLMDAQGAGAGSIDVSDLQNQVEGIIYQYMSFKIFHLADRAEPWVDSTPLSAIRKPSGVYLRVPPLMWADRDPSMQLFMAGAEYGAGAGLHPTMTSSVRALEGTLSINIEGIWLPDPDLCPDFWPGELCPKNTIGMSKYYNGQILSARKKAE